MSRSSLVLRAAALLGAGALGLHELRYRVGYAEHADEALVAHGHGYLSLAGALVAVLLLAACLRFCLSLLRAWRGREHELPRPSLVASWLASSGALSAVYVGQEGLEGLWAAGHPAGLHGIVAHGGWSAFLFALLIGLLIALLLRGASAAIAFASGRDRIRSLQPPLPARHRQGVVFLPPLKVLARHLAGRGPPPLLR